MKRTVLLLAMFGVLSGCATLKNGVSNYRQQMTGNWLLQDVSVEGQEGSFKITLFNEALIDCFVGSAWTLTRPNSGGSYTLNNGADCQAGLQRNIIWTIHKTGTGEQQFQFKRMDDMGEPMDNNVGYRLDILGLSETEMVLRDEVEFNGEPLYLVYTFFRQ